MSRLLGIARRLRLPAAAAVAGGAGTALYVRGAEAEYLAVSESTLPKSYDPAALHAVWSQHPRVALARVCRIAALGSPWVARCAATRGKVAGLSGRRGAIAAGGARRCACC